MVNPVIWLSGARAEILDRHPTDRAKYFGLGSAVLITSVIAGISLGCASVIALDLPLGGAVLAGVLWSLAIMLLDRWLVVSIQRRTRPWQNVIPVTVRLAMALLLSAVFSTPLVLQVFQPEIRAELVEIQHEEYNAGIARQPESTVGRRIGALEEELKAARDIRDSRGELVADPAADPELSSLQKRKKEQDVLTRQHYEDWKCEADGLEGCVAGEGPLAEAKRKDYLDAKKRGDELADQIEQRVRELTAPDEDSRAARMKDAEETIERLGPELESLRGQQENERRVLRERVEAADGLLVQLKALDRVAEEDSQLALARLLLLLLLITIECLPVLLKVLMLLGPKTAYERAEELEAEERLKEFTIQIRAYGIRGLDGGDPENEAAELEEILAGKGAAAEVSAPRPEREDGQGDRRGASARRHEDEPRRDFENDRLREMKDPVSTGQDADDLFEEGPR